MKTYIECYPCFLRQALTASQSAGATDSEQFTIMQDVLSFLQSVQADWSPPQISSQLHGIVRRRTGGIDAYHHAKQQSTQQALALYPRLKNLVSQSSDPLDAALRVSIAGNIIDLAFCTAMVDLWETVERVMNLPYAIDSQASLRSRLNEVQSVLFLADNAGETVFDRVLIETLALPVIYAVKGAPIINDATLEDAHAAGLDGCTQLVTTGSDAPGTILNLCSLEFQALFEQSPLIIAKGQANYETLSEAGPRVYCLLQVKCPVIGRDIGAPVGSIVIRQSAVPQHTSESRQD